MKIFTEIGAIRAFLAKKKSSNKSIGLVPTMGALHDGHLALMKASKSENDITVCSIFVNPIQFNNPADLEKYPRTLEKDIQLLKSVKCDVLFCPETSEMYPSQPSLKMSFGELETVMEGKFRPGHFSGVAIVVSKLFNIIQPHLAYFGQKDFQQLKVVENLVEELSLDITIRSIPIFREPDGLAMSSRNARLTSEQRSQAIVFYHSLKLAKQKLMNGISFSDVQKEVKNNIEKIPGLKLEYLEMASVTNLKLLNRVSKDSVLLIAGYVGEIRLIDNLLMDQ